MNNGLQDDNILVQIAIPYKYIIDGIKNVHSAMLHATAFEDVTGGSWF